MQKSNKPNILLIIADDIGWFDVGAYHRGMMGAATPNIDRIAREGVMLTDCYVQTSCTAGRAAFIAGQLLMRTGLTTVGLPGATQGLRPEDPTLAERLKPEGYMTAQIGKNHPDDRNEFLPTVHGFDVPGRSNRCAVIVCQITARAVSTVSEPGIRHGAVCDS